MARLPPRCWSLLSRSSRSARASRRSCGEPSGHRPRTWVCPRRRHPQPPLGGGRAPLPKARRLGGTARSYTRRGSRSLPCCRTCAAAGRGMISTLTLGEFRPLGEMLENIAGGLSPANPTARPDRWLYTACIAPHRRLHFWRLGLDSLWPARCLGSSPQGVSSVFA